MTRRIIKYNLSMRVLHWLLSIIIISNLTVGFWMTSLEPPFKFTVYGLHKSFGMLVMILVCIRLITRVASEIPALPREISVLESILSKIGVFCLYVCMIGMPISGYLTSTFFGYPVQLFGLTVPAIVSPDSALGAICGDAHTLFGYAFASIILLHVLATFKHIAVDKVNLIRRMI